MRSLTVLLLEGFDDDEVVVSVDGREVDRRPGITSSPLVGMAAELGLRVADDAVDVTVAVPARGLAATTPLPPGDATVLAEVAGDTLTLRPGTGREGGM
jgi:hypothetical protein